MSVASSKHLNLVYPGQSSVIFHFFSILTNPFPFPYFRTVILPIFRENEGKIDQVVNQGKEKLAELTEKTVNAVEAKKSS